jgi:hypothetical protein
MQSELVIARMDAEARDLSVSECMGAHTSNESHSVSHWTEGTTSFPLVNRMESIIINRIQKEPHQNMLSSCLVPPGGRMCCIWAACLPRDSVG